AAAEGKRGLERRDVLRVEHELRGGGVLADVLDVRGLRDGEHSRPAREERERHLARRDRVALGHALQGLAARPAGRKRRAPEGRVADDGDAVRGAERDDRVLDRALAQVIKHLIARDAIRAGEREGHRELVLVEVAEPPRADLPLLAEVLEGRSEERREGKEDTY